MFRSTVGSSSLSMWNGCYSRNADRTLILHIDFEAEMRQVKATQTLDLDLTFN